MLKILAVNFCTNFFLNFQSALEIVLEKKLFAIPSFASAAAIFYFWQRHWRGPSFQTLSALFANLARAERKDGHSVISRIKKKKKRKK